MAAAIPYDGLAPGYVGLYQFDVTVPSNAPSGNAAPFTFTLGGFTLGGAPGAQALYTAVQAVQ